MTYRTHPERYWNICGFLSDEEVHKIYDIIDDALDRKGYHGMADNGELSIRIYDDNLKQNVDVNSSSKSNSISVTLYFIGLSPLIDYCSNLLCGLF